MGPIQRMVNIFQPWVLAFVFLAMLSVLAALMGCGKSRTPNSEGDQPPDTAAPDVVSTATPGELIDGIPQCPLSSLLQAGSEPRLLAPIRLEEKQRKTLMDELLLIESQYRAHSRTGYHRIRVCFDDIGLSRFRFGPAGSPFRTDIYVRPYYGIRIELVGEHGQQAGIFSRIEEAEELALTPNHQFATREALLQQIHEAKQVVPTIDRYLERLAKREESEIPEHSSNSFSFLGSQSSWNGLFSALSEKQQERKVLLHKDETYRQYEWLLGKYRGGNPPDGEYGEVTAWFHEGKTFTNFRIGGRTGASDAAWLFGAPMQILRANTWPGPTGHLEGTFEWGEIAGRQVVIRIQWNNGTHWTRRSAEELFYRPAVSDGIDGLGLVQK